MYILKKFQLKAVDELKESFFKLWGSNNYKLPLIFHSPTGSGKTIMVADFLLSLKSDERFRSADLCYIWVSFGGKDNNSLVQQSKNKLWKYANEGTEFNLKDIGNLGEGKLEKNEILFVNWESIKGSDKSSKKLRRPTEYTGEIGIFDKCIKETHEDGRDIVLIIDEAHRQASTKLSEEVINLLNPRIRLQVTATPDNLPTASDVKNNRVGYVEVNEGDVIKSGLIKEKIIIQTEEEIQEQVDKGLGEDEIMLELAYKKRLELKLLYEELGLDINPLMLVQLPSDMKEEEKSGAVKNKMEMVLAYLEQKGVDRSNVAIWLDKTKQNLADIEKNSNPINFMLFKVAAATGWDCPRADVLVMFREISNPSFQTQIIGRIKRMPQAKHYSKTALNNAYIYTNYDKNHIRDIKQADSPNKPPVFYTRKKQQITPIELATIFYHQTDFNTLTPPQNWQISFFNTLDKYFNTSIEDTFENNEARVGNKIHLYNNTVQNKIVTDAEITSFDDFISQIKDNANSTSYSFSEQDVERFYNLLCLDELKKQQVNEAKYNPSRSWGQLKMALNVWFATRFGLHREQWYKVIVNELLELDSQLKKAIHQALIDFRSEYEKVVASREMKEVYDLSLPAEEVSYTEEYEQIPNIEKNIYEKFYLKKAYKGRENELSFIQFLETQSIDWWHKQGDSGRNNFAIEYYDSQEKRDRLFYPDFIILKDKNLYILDTKHGNTAKSQETADKNNALQKWIKENQSKYDFNLVGGIVIPQHPNWKINDRDNYIYENDEDWNVLSF